MDADGRLGRCKFDYHLPCLSVYWGADRRAAGGMAADVQLGGSKAAGVPKMGILAALQLDGAVSLYAVPHPSAVDGVKDEGGPVYRTAPVHYLEAKSVRR